MSAVLRKSVTDLTRRKARAFFTVLSLALAVASVGIFAVPQLMEQSMQREVASHRLPDVTVSMNPLQLSAADLAALGRLPNVTAVEPRSLFATRVWVGERRERAIVIGVGDYAASVPTWSRSIPGRPRPAAACSPTATMRTPRGSTPARAPTRACSPPTGASRRSRSSASDAS
jgi:hypothetical protein